jgi:hypothetical protein
VNRLLSSTFALLVLSGSVVGCKSRAQQFCDLICDCEGCGDNEYEDCLDDARDLEEEIEEEDCGAELDEYLDCVFDKADCDDDDLDVGNCGDEYEELAECCDNDCG